MKINIVLFLLLTFFVSVIRSQNEQITSHNLTWNGVVQWNVDSSAIKVISFEGAQYPTEDRLPYFNQRLVCDPDFSYNVALKNPVYISLTSEESVVLTSNKTFSSEPEIVSSVLHQRGTSFFNVRILPFVNRNGNILKLQSFDLQINKKTLPQKISGITSHTYASNSVLAHGKFVKIKIVNSGVYKLTYEDLVAMGIDPANVRIFGYGGAVLEQNFLLPKIDDLPELSIYMNKGSDGVFNAGDYILFYGQGINKWTYDTSKSMFTHEINSYSKYGYYFVTSDAGVGKRIEEKSISVPESATINPVEEFTDYQVYEKELINLASSGKEFYGETFNEITSYNLAFSFPNPLLSNTTAVRLDVAANSANASSFSLTLNGSQAKTLSVAQRNQSDSYEMAVGNSAKFTFTPQSDSFNFNISYLKSSSTSIGYLNFLEVNVRRQLKMSGSVMQFQNVDYLGQSTYNQYLLSDATANVQIWDINDPLNISKITTQVVNGKVVFVDSGNDVKSYLAIDPTTPSAFQKPEIVGVVPNQDLHGIAQADMVIITYPDFLSQAQTLAQAHREKDNLTVEVVTTDQVYNEFSSGTPDATAYRWIMKMLYDRALNSNNASDLPKYLLLFGRGSYDNRKVIPNNSGDNLILTYQADNSLETTLSYVTDDYFALLDDNEGSSVSSDLMDIGVGRFPVTSVQQATDVVNKTIAYMNNQDKGYWKNQLCFLADDGGNGDGSIHMTQADAVAVSVATIFPAYQVNKIYLDAYKQDVNASGESYPGAKTHLLNLIQSGLFLLDFTGHAGPTGLTNESVLSLSDVKILSNKHLPLFVAATCDFLQFDSQTVSGGEQVVLNPYGGGIGILSAARPVYSSQNFILNKLVCDNLFVKQNGKHLRVGDVISTAKNNSESGINKLSYIYMGDPALMLNYPTTYHVVTSKINNEPTGVSDTLRALSVATVQGYIADDTGTKVDNFNGNLHAVIYDKVQKIITLNNHSEPIPTSLHGADSIFFSYKDRPNTLFSGNAEVKNGEFNFSYMLPKDIKYNYGGGRIDYYAEDDTNNSEAQGYFENFIVGGTSLEEINDTTGPAVKLYLNSENFVSGDKVNETPLFIANVNDVNGINTVGSGIGHDILLTLDKDPAQSYVLNDYFQAIANSYTTGYVKYKLPLLTNGKHTLSFKVSDLLNNSSVNSIDFNVVTGLAPQIFSVYNFPNPVKTQTSIIVNHDRPETILKTTIEIFDLSGRKIWSFSQSSADSITWNLTGNDGLRVKSGIYLYRVSIKTSDSDVTSKTNKMLIIEQ